jgi:hypothetical protein
VRRPGVLGPDQQAAAAAKVASGCSAAAAGRRAATASPAATAALCSCRVEHSAAEDAPQLFFCAQVARLHSRERRRLLAAGRDGGGRGRRRDAQLLQRAVDLVQLTLSTLALPLGSALQKAARVLG